MTNRRLPSGHSLPLPLSFSWSSRLAYYHYHFSGQLEVWQLLVCILAWYCLVAHFHAISLERSLQLCLQTANRKDDELFRKVYFDLKEVGNELETLAVKVDKVPTLVDKIVSDSTKDLTQLAELSEALTETKELALKLANLEELATQGHRLQNPIRRLPVPIRRLPILPSQFLS